MHLFNSTNENTVETIEGGFSISSIKRLFFIGGMLLNLIIFINLIGQQTELNIEKSNLIDKEYEISQRENAISESLSKLDEYNDYLQEQTEQINEKIRTINDQYETLSTISDEIYSSESIYIPTPDEIDNLYKLVYAEAGNQPYEGKVAVAEVVFNRIECPDFPDNINDTIFDKYQFSPCYDGQDVRLSNGEKVSEDKITTEIKQAVAEAWSGSNITETLLRDEAYSEGIYDSSYWEGGALYFVNPKAIKNTPLYARVMTSTVRVDIEDHCFRRKY